MATRTLETIMYELNPTYEAQANVYRDQMAGLSGQQQQAQQVAQDQHNTSLGTLERQRDDYNYSANTNASTRGLGWSNVGQNYAADYNKNSFTPAVTQLNNDLSRQQQSIAQNYSDRHSSLEQALAALEMDRSKTAQSIWQQEQDRATQQSAAQANLDLQKYIANLQNPQAEARPTIRLGSELGYTDQNGFYFFDAAGKPIKAATYAAQTGEGIQSVLNQLAQRGDTNAKNALNYLTFDRSGNITGERMSPSASTIAGLRALGVY